MTNSEAAEVPQFAVGQSFQADETLGKVRQESLTYVKLRHYRLMVRPAGRR